MEHGEMTEQELPAGTVVHIQGIPVVLSAPARAASHSSNWSAIQRLAEEWSAPQSAQGGAIA